MLYFNIFVLSLWDYHVIRRGSKTAERFLFHRWYRGVEAKLLVKIVFRCNAPPRSLNLQLWIDISYKYIATLQHLSFILLLPFRVRITSLSAMHCVQPVYVHCAAMLVFRCPINNNWRKFLSRLLSFIFYLYHFVPFHLNLQQSLI